MNPIIRYIWPDEFILLIGEFNGLAEFEKTFPPLSYALRMAHSMRNVRGEGGNILGGERSQ
jgi:hypothetical protein